MTTQEAAPEHYRIAMAALDLVSEVAPMNHIVKVKPGALVPVAAVMAA